MKKPLLPTGDIFDNFSYYWSEIADAHATLKQVDAVKNKVANAGLILDLGCGNGRHTLALSKEGYQMVGLDISHNLLKIAKQRMIQFRVSAELVRADMRALPFRQKIFKAVVSLDSSFGYLLTKDEDLLSFKEVAMVLESKGTFFLDVFNLPHMVQTSKCNKKTGKNPGATKRKPLSPHRFINWREYPDFFLSQKRRVLAGKGLLVDSWLLHNKNKGKTKFIKHVIRLFRLNELKLLASSVGLCLSGAFGDYEGNNYSENSKRLIVLFRKTSNIVASDVVCD